MTAVLDQLRKLKIVPVIVIDDAVNAIPLATALSEGGLPCMEITFRTANALEALRRITAEQPGMLAGAGTVLTKEQAAAARDAGAAFIVAPGFSPAVVDYCLEHNVPVYPGVATPTEIEMALSRGLSTVKFFPAEPMGGVAYLKAIAAPYGMLEFMPTGGINTRNILDYLAFTKVVACGGSWMAPADWIAAGDYERIRKETIAAVETVNPQTGAAS
ncbi:MAG TPA: bifunctional 4-hydroxy-2-oxoglutarate aldolase/2-dehydro-3-deoxy-phosphogluconate aldolase [Longimicrobiales bacterium]|nr:bifunctional 4-hydroxy-2-oxoglutarate aldolase/2-dehydro-3-deoxy-phosphogluconate aldolase [Longimicrobiales bacterium]